MRFGAPEKQHLQHCRLGHVSDALNSQRMPFATGKSSSDRNPQSTTRLLSSSLTQPTVVDINMA